jgi:hypothetical protein
MNELILYTTEEGRSQIKLLATARHLDFDQRRKQEEARLANAQDDAELSALENTLKTHSKP